MGKVLPELTAFDLRLLQVFDAVVQLDREDPGRATDDRRELDSGVQVEPEREAEAVTERCRQQAGARRRSDERERRLRRDV